MRTNMIIAIIVLCIVVGCGDTNPPHPGWMKLVGNGVSIWLPAEYHQIDLNNLSKESIDIENINPTLSDIYNDIDTSSVKIALWAVNFETGDNIFIYSNSPEDEVELYQSQKDNSFAMTKAILSAKKTPFAGARALDTDVHSSGKIWSIYGLSEEMQFPKTEVVFKKGLETVKTIP